MAIDLRGVVLGLVDNVELVERAKEHLLRADDRVTNDIECSKRFCGELRLTRCSLRRDLSGHGAESESERGERTGRGRHCACACARRNSGLSATFSSFVCGVDASEEGRGGLKKGASGPARTLWRGWRRRARLRLGGASEPGSRVAVGTGGGGGQGEDMYICGGEAYLRRARWTVTVGD